MKIRKYFLLNDFANEDEELTPQKWLYNILSAGEDVAEYAEKLTTFIALKHQFDCVVYIDYLSYWHEPSDPEEESLQEWKNKFKYVFFATVEKYKTLLASYTALKDDLLNGIKSTQKTKFNDTPQTEQTGLDADSYASTYTVSESELGFDAIEKLAKINSLYEHVINLWCKDFDSLFIKF